MNDDFATAMRRSLQQTRAGNPVEATRLIQEALRGGRGGASDLPPVSSAHRSGHRSDVEEAEVVETTPPRRPLGKVVAGLRNRPQGFSGQGLRMPQPVTAPGVPPGARFERRQFKGPVGARDYRLYLPSTHGSGITGLVVMLHGCTQSPEDFAAGTAMNAQAEQHGFAVIWPEQTRMHNPSLCWNWFRATDQRRSGEPAILHAIAASVADEFSVPDVFVAGLSAGGAMAAILAQNYAETFSAVGVHSGLAPGSAQDVVSAFGAMRGDTAGATEALRAPVIVFHGTDDRTVAPVNVSRITGPLSAETQRSGHAADQSGGRRFTVTGGRNATGHPVEVWSIEGSGHAWSGGSASGSYTDPAGPDASAEMLRFFRQHKDGVR